MADHGVSSRNGLHSYSAALKEIGNANRPEVGRRFNKSSGEFGSTVSATRTSHATVSKYQGTTKTQLSSCSGLHQERHLISDEVYKQRRSAALAERRVLAA
jgi:putative transposase